MSEAGVMETARLIKQTELEVLAETYKKQNEVCLNSKLNTERTGLIARQVREAFLFLLDLGKPLSDMTFQEFEIAQKEIKERAQKRIDKQRIVLQKTLFFKFVKRSKLKRDIVCQQFLLDQGHIISRTYSFNQYLKNKDYKDTLPTNFSKLVREIFAMRYGMSSTQVQASGKGV